MHHHRAPAGCSVTFDPERSLSLEPLFLLRGKRERQSHSFTQDTRWGMQVVQYGNGACVMMYGVCICVGACVWVCGCGYVGVCMCAFAYSISFVMLCMYTHTYIHMCMSGWKTVSESHQCANVRADTCTYML